ncbi:MAG TPA: glucose/galactose MFS transporter [Rhizomicrobium sp.]|jgi:FHS family L-fucose permease-like MFS transporter|nr:glucose/galactose MFS transporter [Rhizomicrobium sp.]
MSRRFNPAFATVTTLFFMWGFVTATIDPLVPSVRGVFSLTYAESMLTQFAFFLAYGVISLPAALVLEKLGYARTIVLSLTAMLAGCLLMPVATHAQSYALVLCALFVIAAGIAQLQVAANPLAALLGPPEGSHFRLTLSQAFNSLGTVLAPILGSYVMLRGGVFATGAAAAARTATLGNVSTQFLAIAALILLLTLFIWGLRRLLSVPHELDDSGASPLAAFASRWALFGALAIFLYVGAEVAISSIMINFLHQPRILGESYEHAGRLLGLFYWGGAMAGRALGSIALTRLPAHRVLAFAALAALCLCLAVTGSAGMIAGAAALAIGFFNSIMFPTIFTLTLERSTAPVAATSGLLCMAIVGGAVLPVIAGLVADRAGLALAFFVPAVSYAVIAGFALAGGNTCASRSQPPA